MKHEAFSPCIYPRILSPACTKPPFAHQDTTHLKLLMTRPCPLSLSYIDKSRTPTYWALIPLRSAEVPLIAMYKYLACSPNFDKYSPLSTLEDIGDARSCSPRLPAFDAHCSKYASIHGGIPRLCTRSVRCYSKNASEPFGSTGEKMRDFIRLGVRLCDCRPCSYRTHDFAPICNPLRP